MISNAIKYSPNSDRLIINTENKFDSIIISVKDFGIGIPKGKDKLVFNRFFRINEQEYQPYPGLGLGLYISKEIISKHNGSIWAESEEGKGSVFFVKLPRNTIEQNKERRLHVS